MPTIWLWGGFGWPCLGRVLNRKTGPSWQDWFFARKNPSGGEAFHPRSAMSYRLSAGSTQVTPAQSVHGQFTYWLGGMTRLAETHQDRSEEHTSELQSLRHL